MFDNVQTEALTWEIVWGYPHCIQEWEWVCYLPVIISGPPKAIVAYVFPSTFLKLFFLGLGLESGGYSGPPWRLGVRA